MKPPASGLSRVLLTISLLILQPVARAQNLAGDEALSRVLIDGEGWQLVADGFGFTDAASADAKGNFYFFDLGKGTGIKRIGADGQVTTFIDNAPKCSGLIAKPQNKGTVSVAFAGPNLEYLYVCSSDRIYRRKTQAKGVLFFQAPVVTQQK